MRFEASLPKRHWRDHATSRDVTITPSLIAWASRCNKWSSASFGGLLRGARAMATGTMKWFNATKGFGFIQPDAGGADVFVHISAVERAGMRDLNEGQKIAYEVLADRRTCKSSADNLKPA
jgi:cold shock protein